MDLRSLKYFPQNSPIASSILKPEHVDPREVGIFNLGELLVEDFVTDLSTYIVACRLIILGIIFKNSDFLFQQLL